MKVYSHTRKASEGITEAQAYLRTLSAIRTMDRLPGPTRYAVRSSWPQEFEFHAVAIKWAIFAGEAAENKAYKRLRYSDFEDVDFGFDKMCAPLVKTREVQRGKDIRRASVAMPSPSVPGPMRVGDFAAERVRASKKLRADLAASKSELVSKFKPHSQTPTKREEDEEREDDKPTRADIANAEIAGAWFAAIALLPHNREEFANAVAAFTKGKRKTVWVDDQRIIAMHARGASLKTIGTLLHGGKLNAEQVAARIEEITRALADIANGRSCSNDRGKGAPSRKPSRASAGAR